MIVTVDEEAGIVTIRDGMREERHLLASSEGFAAVSRVWLRAGWDTKYVYGFSWLGRPIIQLPDDLIRIQEAIYSVKPDVIIETGIAYGGSLIFFASLLKAIGRGRVIGIDSDIRPHNRSALEAHELAPLLTLIEGNSTDPAVVEQVRTMIRPTDSVLVVLDSDHSRQHVADELRAYGSLVSVGSYVIVEDGIMGEITGAPRTRPDWDHNNPRQAALAFVAANPNFLVEEPRRPFNEGIADRRVTYWPDGFIRRLT
jgi:cephalosporin hydroxylase